MRRLYPVDYDSPYGTRYRLYLTRDKMQLIFPDFDKHDEEDSWYNCRHDKAKGIRRDKPRNLSSDEETFAIDEGYRIIENPKYNPPNRDCKQCNR
jgi:hypothetical protein